MNQRYDVCIIGGGAAGLAAAASMGGPVRTCILEKNKIPGRKLLATGGGRCNLTNTGCRGSAATLEFFAFHGLECRCDSEGRWYPYSGCASDVVRVLEEAARSRGCEIITDCSVQSIEKTPEGRFLIWTEGSRDSRSSQSPQNSRTRQESQGSQEGLVRADLVLLACGGKAGPQFGTIGDGYRLARALGHQVSRLYPILTGIECGDMRDLKGIRAQGRVDLLKDGEKIASERGEIQFVEKGLSGICVFNLTPYIHAEEGESVKDSLSRYELVVDLAPDFSRDQIDQRTSTFGILTGKLADRIGTEEIKNWHLPVLGIKGWRDAQCTAGGIILDEVDMDTMESRLIEGLYFAGEILDIQGPCGGYNLQNAWETGIKAARAMTARLSDDQGE